MERGSDVSSKKMEDSEVFRRPFGKVHSARWSGEIRCGENSYSTAGCLPRQEQRSSSITLAFAAKSR